MNTELLRVVELRGVKLELIFVENLERESRCDEHVNVEINEREYAVFETDWSVDVAVEITQPAVRLAKAEDAVPAIGIKKLGAVCAGYDGSEERVTNLLFKNTFEDN